MGRDKKKGKKETPKPEAPKAEEPSLSALSISDEPSTSREASAPPEDQGVGLGLGTSKKRGKKKGAESSIPPAAPETTVVAAPPVAPVVAQEPTPEPPGPEEEEDGLGLGKSKKRNRPKKKKDGGDAAIKAAASAVPPQSVPVVTQPATLSTVPSWGRGSTWGRGQAGPPVQQEPPRPGQPAQTHSVGRGHPVPPGQHYPTPGQFGPPGLPASGQPPPGLYPVPGQQLPPVLYPAQGQQLPPGQYPTSGQRPPGQYQAPGQPAPVQYPAQAAQGPSQSRPPRQAQSAPAQPTQAQARPMPTPSRSEGTICRYQIPDKIIGRSVRCRQLKVLTNYLQMTIKPLKIYRYDVSFKPDKPKKLIPKAYMAAKNLCFPRHMIAFDQMKNCYALQPLPKVTDTERFAVNVEIADNNNRIITYEVSFKGTGIVDLGTILSYMSSGGTSLNPPTEAIQCVDVILRQGTLESYIKSGRTFFKRPARPIDLGDGLEMWTGLFQSAIFTVRPYINIDVAHKGFPKYQPLTKCVTDDFNLKLTEPITRQRGRGVDNFLAFIKGLRVVATIAGNNTATGLKREFICNELVDPPIEKRFTMTDANGKQEHITVAEYFQRVHNVRLQYPRVNCMWVGPRDKNIFYPLELLHVSYGQVLNKQLNEMQLSKMVREAATPPDDRKRKIEEVINDMDYSRNPYFKQFGMEIKDEFFAVDAKVLQPPRLDVGGGTVDPRNGQWQAQKLLKPEALESWGFIALELDPDRSNAESVISLLKSCGNQMGMRVSEPKERFFNVRIQALQNVLLTALQKEIRFLVIVVSGYGRDYYHKVKQMAEQEVGILTQCIKDVTAQRRMNPQTARNILLKVNSKLMGINQALSNVSMPRCLADGGVMVVGADVTHPSPDQTSVPSIAAVTASIDPKCFIYNIELSVQTPKKEMIVEFEDMMVTHLQIYKQRQGIPPRKIFVFRDGVSEGQFAQVMNSELQAVHNAYQRIAGPKAKPEVLFLLVQKRHHTRLFLGDRNSKNVEPGTVVDTDIVHARELDFYMVSHQAIKGTARPTRYHAVCNDGKLPNDEVEQLTYYLCHLYSRCMRAVSYPTPTYYAHLACLRARSLTYGKKFDNKELERKPQRLRVMDKMLQFSRMFFV